jgi:diguanylate cyclase (GGDEF)-like protein
MRTTRDVVHRNRRIMSLTAAAMYGGAAFVGLVEGVLPGSPTFSVIPGISALVIVTGLVVGARWTPRWMLALLGPVGVALIAWALAASPGAGDGAVLYMWPVLWTAYFYGRSGALAIVACVAVAHGVAVLTLPTADRYVDRWVDVLVSVAVVAFVVQLLSRRNEYLLARVSAEARTDTLTKLLNRRGFDERAAIILEQARRSSQSVAIASFDLDHFKRINDEWGHDAGDQVLTDFAALLHLHARGVDAVARLGGEEFVTLLPNCDVRDAHAFTQRIRAALATQNSNLPTVHVSAGVAAEVAPATIKSLLRNADTALYAAKRAGRNVTARFQADEPQAAPTAADRPLAS